MTEKELDLIEKFIELVIVRMHSEHPNMRDFRDKIAAVKQELLEAANNEQ